MDILSVVVSFLINQFVQLIGAVTITFLIYYTIITSTKPRYRFVSKPSSVYTRSIISLVMVVGVGVLMKDTHINFAAGVVYAIWNLAGAWVILPIIYRELATFVDRQSAPAPITAVDKRPAAVAMYARALTKYPSFHKDLVRIFESKYYEGVNPEQMAIDTDYLMADMPEVLEPSATGKPLTFFFPLDDEAKYRASSTLRRLGDMAEDVGNLKVRVVIPTNLRTSHQSVVGGAGHGKTTLFKSMIVDDLKEEACIIVIDSQRGVINQLAERIDPSRLVLIDPETCPPALNLFANAGTDEVSVGRALSMFNFIFESRNESFTAKQAGVYRYLSRLCMLIPGANLATMRDMCKPGELLKPEYQKYIDQLGDNGKAFFDEFNQAKGNEYGDTKKEVQRRLVAALDSPTFSKMLGAKTMRLNILKEIEAGKVILVNTDKNRLQEGAALFGRVFAGLVMQAVRSRPELTGKRVYLYIDEFADYASDAALMRELFSQGRKYNLCMIVAFQNLAQLTPLLAADMSASTAIKMAGGVSAEDLGPVSRQLQTDPDILRTQPQGTFLAHFKGIGTIPYPVRANRLEALPKHGRTQEVIDRMRREYGEEPASAPSPNPPEEDDFKEAF